MFSLSYGYFIRECPVVTSKLDKQGQKFYLEAGTNVRSSTSSLHSTYVCTTGPKIHSATFHSFRPTLSIPAKYIARQEKIDVPSSRRTDRSPRAHAHAHAHAWQTVAFLNSLIKLITLRRG